MKISFLFVLLISLSTLCISCAGPEENQRETRSGPVEFDPDLCKEQMGFDRGYSDGLSQRTMDSSFTLRCRDDLRAATVKGYRDGFEKGIAESKDKQERNYKYSRRNRGSVPQTYPQTSMPPQTYPPQEQPVAGSNNKIFNINIGGGKQVNTPASYPAAPTSNPKAFYCSVSAFNTSFDAFGPTELEARQMAVTNCSNRYHKMHCDDVSCQRNQ